MQITLEHLWTYSQWFFEQAAWLRGSLLAASLILLGLLISYVVALIQFGPGEAFYAVARVIRDLFRVDLPGTRWNRILAIAKLAFKEAVRRKILVGFGIFIILLMFAGWFLDRRSEKPAELYISTVLTATNFLMLLLGLFISTFSLPQDIKSKTIYTIATKPVRPTEIIVGRILGFGFIGSLLLATLGIFGYVFVTRGLNHRHEVSTVSKDGRQGKTNEAAFHEHTFTLDEEGRGLTDEVKGHQHTVTAIEVDGQTKYVIGPPSGQLTARVPIFGSLTFFDRQGNVGEGLNVGYMSEYRKFIAGGTLSSANWRFQGVDKSGFPDGLIIELNIEAFRTIKADIITPVRGSIILRSLDQSAETERIYFYVKESLDRKIVPLQYKGFKNNQPATLDIFGDIIVNGEFEAIVRCEDSQQYFGMSPADLTLRAGDRSFAWNYFKGFVGIWLQMVIVIAFGVMFSTFLSGPVAMVATLSAFGLGFFGSNVDYFFDPEHYEHSGGGPIESIIRIGTQKGVMIDLDLGNEALEMVIKNVDYGIMYMILNLKYALPDFSRLGTSEFVAYGVNIFDALLWRHITITVGYCLMTSLIGYFFLKTRELAA
jgi:hypothetical protein